MTTKTVTDTTSAVIEDRQQLIDFFASGEKPAERWRIGTEHEKFVYRTDDHRAPALGRARRDPRPAQRTDRVRLEAGRGERQGHRDDRRRRLDQPRARGPVRTVGRAARKSALTCAETGRHLEQVKAVGDKLGLGFLGLGMWPDKTRAELPIMPKGRYAIMLRHMPRVGSMGLDMMLRTCTIQVNLDYASEADMVQKFRVGLALQPLATALFANSPFTEGKPNGMLSYRSHIWSDTDPHRTGMLPFVFEDGFGYERYADYALDVPMYFVYRDGQYLDASGLSFRDFLKGELSILPGEKPTIDDLSDHLSTAFPEVRLKTFLEMRGADGGPWGRICALPAFGSGCSTIRARSMRRGTWSRTGRWPTAQALANAVPKLALDAPLPGGGKLRDIAGEVLDIAHAGLTARARTDAGGSNETGFLEPLREIVRSRQGPGAGVCSTATMANGRGDISRVYGEMSF